MSDARLDRYRDAYLAMAHFYRPQAPGDGFGNVTLSGDEIADPARLQREAIDYAIGFNVEEDTHSFWVGCSDFETNKAFVWTIEAARCLASGANDEAIKLLRMAATEVARVRRKNPSLRDILAAG